MEEVLQVKQNRPSEVLREKNKKGFLQSEGMRLGSTGLGVDQSLRGSLRGWEKAKDVLAQVLTVPELPK